MAKTKSSYYVPESSHWPIVGTIGLLVTVIGTVNWIHGSSYGPYVFFVGMLIFLYMIYGWFRNVIQESRAGLYSKQMDRSFRLGMSWFIFSEVMFFAALFGALFYARHFVVPWLGGEGTGLITHLLLWPNFQGTWPVFVTPDPSQFLGPKTVTYLWGLPALCTLVLLVSAVTLVVGHWGLLKKNRIQLIICQTLTIILGAVFLALQLHEFNSGYSEGLRLSSGIYGSTYYMIAGFHSLHIFVGLIMLFVILMRILKGHFTPDNHFAFSAVSWYWHFINVTWLFSFVFVYWM